MATQSNSACVEGHVWCKGPKGASFSEVCLACFESRQTKSLASMTLADHINAAQSDDDIDTSEIPELDATFFESATLTRPGESLIKPSDNLDDGDFLDRLYTRRS